MKFDIGGRMRINAGSGMSIDAGCWMNCGQEQTLRGVRHPALLLRESKNTCIASGIEGMLRRYRGFLRQGDKEVEPQGIRGSLVV